MEALLQGTQRKWVAPLTIKTRVGPQSQLPRVALKVRTLLMQVQALDVGTALPKAFTDASQDWHLKVAVVLPIMIWELILGQAQKPWGYHLSTFERQVHCEASVVRVAAYIAALHTTQEYVPLLMAMTEPRGQPHFLPADSQESEPRQTHRLPSEEGPLE